MDLDKKSCYVITPYGRRDIGGGVMVDFDEVFNQIITKGVELVKGCQLVLTRSIDEKKTGPITEEFIRHILNAEIAIIDVSSGNTYGNANVFYELGLRHAFRKRISVIIAVDDTRDKLPFDIKDLNVIFYDRKTADGQKKAAEEIAQFIDGALSGNRVDSPVYRWIPGYAVNVPSEKCTEKYERHFLVRNCPSKRIGVKAGDLPEIEGVDVWVNAENTEMEMGRLYDRTVSGLIRYHGAILDSHGWVKKDLIQDYLRKRVGRGRRVMETTVIVTDPGRLQSRGVKKLLHVAAFLGEYGDGYHPVKALGKCVTNALEELQQLNSRRRERWIPANLFGGEPPVLTSVLFPIFGARAGDPYNVLSELVTAACNYVKKHPEAAANRIYFQAYSEEEWRLCKDVMERHEELREETFEDLLKEMTLDSRCAWTKSPQGAGIAGDLVGNLTKLMDDAKALRSRQNLAEAVKLLEAGVVRGWAAFSAGEQGVESASVVADCFGMLAGYLMKQKNMSTALAVYRVGRDIEMGVAGMTMTYSTVNLLVTGLLDSGWESLRHAESDIKKAIARLETNTQGVGRGDVWAWANLGMCEFLRHNLGAAEAAYKEAAKRANAENLASMRETLLNIRVRWPQDDFERMAFYESITGILA